MDTATISYRVADFLRKHPPFQAIGDADLLELAGQGRVRFHERNEHILSQGERHKDSLFVIQQGVVSLWDEVDGVFELRDVRGPGDLLGVERFNGAPACLHSARSATDVVIYAFPVERVEALLDRYPHARRFVSAYSTVTLDYQATDERRRPEDVFLHDVVKGKRPVTCRARDSIRDAARLMRASGADAVAVIDDDRRTRGVVTRDRLLEWLADGGGRRDQAVSSLIDRPPPAVAADASVAEGVLAMGAAGAPALAITADGSPGGELHAVVTPGDLAPVFGDQPATLLREIRRASGPAELRALNHRARALTLRFLTSAVSADWLARFTRLVDAAIVARVIALADEEADGRCWCFCGASGRGESLTRRAPDLVLIAGGGQPRSAAAYQRVLDLIGECDYLPRPEGPFEPQFFAASVGAWAERFRGWVRDPILGQTYRARALFDLEPVHGPASLWREVEAALAGDVTRDFLRVLANDCLASLPPLTFFQDAVVDESGEQSGLFRLERSALQPVVDVARVYGLAAGRVLGGSTRERLAMARRLLPARESVFRESSDAFSVMLWQQGRIGIGQGTAGSELPPALLGRHDRQVLRSGFRVILRLIELTASWEWLDAL
jgi:CBS domain-containing protein